MNRMMRTVSKWLAAALWLTPVAATADNSPVLLSLEADAASYVVGDRALLSAHVLAQPSSGRYEWHLKATLAGVPQPVTRLSDEESVVLTAPFESAGESVFRVEMYLQDKDVARSLQGTISYYHEENIRLTERLGGETNPERRAQIMATIARNTEIINLSTAELTEHRRLIEVKEITVTVTATAAPSTAAPADASTSEEPVLAITLDREDATYAVGSAASFFVEVLTNFRGPDGAREAVVTATLDDERLAALSVDDRHTTVTSDLFEVGDEGPHTFTASISIRSKARADALRHAVTAAENRRDELMGERDGTDDPALQAMYQADIDDMTFILDRLYMQLDGLLTPVATESVVITVVP